MKSKPKSAVRRARLVQITQVEGSASGLRGFVGLDEGGVLWGFRRIDRHDSGFDASYWAATILCDARLVKT